MEPQDSDKALRQYLLGGLPEVETETFDELSVINDDFAARLAAVENDLIDAYVRGELDGIEQSQFGSRYLTSPRRREKVKFAQAFQSLAEKRLNTAESVSRWQSARTLFTAPSLKFQWELGAISLLLLVAGALLSFETWRLRNHMDQAQAERIALRQREKELQAQLEQERSAGSEKARELERAREQIARLERQVIAQQPSLPAELNIARFDLAPQMRNRSATITIPPGTNYITLQLELDADDYPAYRAELRTQTGDEKVWSSGRLRVKAKGQNKALDVGIRADKLNTRGYILTLKGIAEDGGEKDALGYAFRVVKQ